MKNFIKYLSISFILLSCSDNNDSNCESTFISVIASTTPTAITSPTGTINITSPTGSEYTYRINSGPYQSSPSFNNLTAGTYNVTAKNSAGCTGTTSVTISSFDCSSTIINIEGTTSNSVSAGSTGTITITSPTGPNYTYSLNSGPYQSSPEFNNLAAGNYTVVAKNEDGCTGSNNFQVNTCEIISSFAGTDTGRHKIFINGIAGSSLGINDITDTMFLSVAASDVLHFNSNFLQSTIISRRNTDNCNKFTFDSIIFAPQDTIRVNSSTLGTIKIYNLRAGGDATFSGTTFNSSIKVKKGNTNLSILPNLQNVEFRGFFKKQ